MTLSTEAAWTLSVMANYTTPINNLNLSSL